MHVLLFTSVHHVHAQILSRAAILLTTEPSLWSYLYNFKEYLKILQMPKEDIKNNWYNIITTLA